MNEHPLTHPRNPTSDTADLVILYALAGGPWRPRDISRHTLLSKSTVLKRLNNLRERGMAIQDKEGKWHAIVRLAPVDASATVIAEAPSPVHEPQKGDPYDEATYVPAPVPGANMAAATHFHVPASLNGAGVLRVGPGKQCVQCQAVTPLVYGDQPVCAKCSRVWRG